MILCNHTLPVYKVCGEYVTPPLKSNVLTIVMLLVGTHGSINGGKQVHVTCDWLFLDHVKEFSVPIFWLFNINSTISNFTCFTSFTCFTCFTCFVGSTCQMYIFYRVINFINKGLKYISTCCYHQA